MLLFDLSSQQLCFFLTRVMYTPFLSSHRGTVGWNYLERIEHNASIWMQRAEFFQLPSANASQRQALPADAQLPYGCLSGNNGIDMPGISKAVLW